MGKKRAAMVELTNQSGYEMEPHLTHDVFNRWIGEFVEDALEISTPMPILMVDSPGEPQNDDCPIFWSDLIRHFVIRGRRLISHCRNVEIGLLTIDPMPGDLMEVAAGFYHERWLTIRELVGYALGTFPSEEISDATLGTIWFVINDTMKLDRLLHCESPKGVFSVEDEAVELIPERVAIEQMRMVVNCFESCLDLIELQHLGKLKPMNSDKSKFDGIIDRPLINPNRLTPFHREILTEIPKPRPVVGDDEFVVLVALLLLKQSIHRSHVRNKANDLGGTFTEENISTTCWRLKKLFLTDKAEKSTLKITELGEKFVRSDVRWTSYQNHV